MGTYHHFRCILQFMTDKYVVTQGYKNLCGILESSLCAERKEISIKGPKGVGKSMALAAVASRYSKKRPCLLWSPEWKLNKNFFDALKEVYRQFGKKASFCIILSGLCVIINAKGKEYEEDDDECVDRCIGRFVKTFPRCIILIELDGMTRLDREQQKNLVLVMSHQVQYVVSLSSGSTRFVSPDDMKSFKCVVGRIRSPDHNAVFLPFDKEEAEVFMNITGEFSLQQKDLFYGLTTYNPKLLSICVGRTNMEA